MLPSFSLSFFLPSMFLFYRRKGPRTKLAVARVTSTVLLLSIPLCAWTSRRVASLYLQASREQQSGNANYLVDLSPSCGQIVPTESAREERIFSLQRALEQSPARLADRGHWRGEETRRDARAIKINVLVEPSRRCPADQVLQSLRHLVRW